MTACSDPVVSPVEPRLDVCGPPFDGAQSEECVRDTGGVAANTRGTAYAEMMR
jgi:hypothetical protein